MGKDDYWKANMAEPFIRRNGNKKAQREYEKKLLKRIIDKPKRFYSYIRSKR